MTDEWIIYDPEDGWQAADSRADFDAVLDHYRDQGGDGWREDVESLALYRLVPVTTVRLVRIASAEDATEDGERCRAAGWDYLSKLVEDQHEDPMLAVCGHSAACLRDGACGWCATVEDARLHMEERDAARKEAHRDHERLAEMGESLLRVAAERAALAAHVKRLQGWTVHSALCALQVAGEPPCNCGLSAVLASTPAVSMEAHDRAVRAEAIRSVAQEIREQDDYTVGETLSRAEASRVAGWLGARAAAIEGGES